jgi:dihydropyrimidinase
LVIKGGTLVTADKTWRSDLGIAGESIAEIGMDLASNRVINATGKLVLPGAIDPHVHLEMLPGAIQSSDDWQSGTIAAAHGGTTTILDFVEPNPGESLRAAIEVRRAQADGKAVIDYGLHMTLRRDDLGTLAEISHIVGAGISSFKTYMTYEALRLSDAALLNCMASVTDAGGIVMAHAENDAAIDYLRSRFILEKKIAPRCHALSRPAAVEVEAVQRPLVLAEIADCPLYVVHISTGRGGRAIAQARLRGQMAHGETCPQYLALNEAEYERPGFEGAKFVCFPPLRSPENSAILWRLLAEGALKRLGPIIVHSFLPDRRTWATRLKPSRAESLGSKRALHCSTRTGYWRGDALSTNGSRSAVQHGRNFLGWRARVRCRTSRSPGGFPNPSLAADAP